MGLFGKKKETTHFERDEEGKVIRTTRNGAESGTQSQYKSTKQLEREYRKEHPTRMQKYWKESGERRTVERGIRREEFQKARLREIKIQSAKRGRASARPVQFTFSSMPPSRSNANPFGSMFDTGLPKSRPKKKKSKVQYKVIGGKAYPIAGTGKRKTKKKTTKHRKTSFGFDPFDNSRWM